MHKILMSPPFKKIMLTHTRDILEFLLSHGIFFNILCDAHKIHFEPPLPKHIRDTFNDVTLFVIAGYTFESARAHTESISFEAGFGNENIGSVVEIPYTSIVQILLHDEHLLREIPLFTNVSHQCLYDVSKEEQKQIESMHEEGLECSKHAFVSNPENSRFFKK